MPRVSMFRWKRFSLLKSERELTRIDRIDRGQCRKGYTRGLYQSRLHHHSSRRVTDSLN